ncbi:hypothetical protein LNQ03_28580 [Klebsiella pneumoniae subsp. pneumoniae]|nr:hypothetical protein [Klebsiella pneumoniae subsp. pneumoniae]
MDSSDIRCAVRAKAGMAAGLFNTVRVAGEGIALAIVSAVLTASNTLTLQSRVHGYAPRGDLTAPADWPGAAGNMPQAAALRLIFPSGCCARATRLCLYRYCLAGWRSSPRCAP